MDKRLITKKNWIVIVLITVIMEVFLFNIRHWDSVLNQKFEDYQISFNGITKTGNLLKVTEENGYIELYGFNEHINNLYLDVSNGEADSVVKVNVQADDATSSSDVYTVDCGEANISQNVEGTKYLRLHLREESSFLRIYFKVLEGTELYLDDLQLNCVQPVLIIWYRVVIIFLLLVIGFLFRGSSALYKERLSGIKMRERVIIIGIFICLSLTMFGVTRAIRPSKTLNEVVAGGNTAQIQYNELTDAILQGHAWIDKDYVNELEVLDNPYDTGSRMELQEKTGHIYPWDYAYYEGKVYCYFGVVPVLCLFLPFKVITGVHLSPWNAISLLSIIWVSVSFLFVYAVCRKYYKNISVAAYCVLSVFMAFGCWTTNLIMIGNVYSLAQVFAILFGVFGVSCWLFASDGKKIRKWLLVLGSISTALVSGCRPQLVLVIFLAFPVFWQEIRARKFFSKEGIWNTLCVILPIATIAAGVMYYNYIRFDSPFDFGATYNLTGGDMVHRGIDWARLPLGFYQYFFKGIDTISTFPFIKRVDSLNDYMGVTSFDEMFGGFFVYNALCLICVFVFALRRILCSFKTYATALLLIILGLVICVLDIQVSGMTGRYLADFGWLFAMASVLILAPLYIQAEKNTYILYKFDLASVFKNIVFLMVGISVFLNLWSLLITDRYFAIVNSNPTLFYMLKTWWPFNI